MLALEKIAPHEDRSSAAAQFTNAAPSRFHLLQVKHAAINISVSGGFYYGQMSSGIRFLHVVYPPELQ